MERWRYGGMEGGSLCERLLPPGVPSLQGQPGPGGDRGDQGGDRGDPGRGQGRPGRGQGERVGTTTPAVSISHRLFSQKPNHQNQPRRSKRHPRAKLVSPSPNHLVKIQKILPSSSKGGWEGRKGWWGGEKEEKKKKAINLELVARKGMRRLIWHFYPLLHSLSFSWQTRRYVVASIKSVSHCRLTRF